MADIKTRASRYDTFCIADRAAKRAFMHLQVRLLTGRDTSVLGRLSEVCIKTLHQAIEKLGTDLHCQLSVEVLEMERSTYKKQAFDGGHLL